jgi:hypothetical protein
LDNGLTKYFFYGYFNARSISLGSFEEVSIINGSSRNDIFMKFRKFIKKTKAIHVRHIDVKKMASGNFLITLHS